MGMVVVPIVVVPVVTDAPKPIAEAMRISSVLSMRLATSEVQG